MNNVAEFQRGDLKALLICSSGWSAKGLAIGQGHVFRCQSFAAQLRKLGWHARVLELHFSSVAGAKLEHIRQTLTDWQDFQFPEDAWDLLLIDSYHLPPIFYKHCADLVPKSCCLLAQDDLNRLATGYYPEGYYPKGYYAIQAGFAGPSGEHSLRGLEYQVLRPEFASDYIVPINRGHYALLVPGSAFSLAQLEAVATVLRRGLSSNLGLDLALLFSERHSAELGAKAFPVEGVSCFQGLSAAELRPLYAGAELIFCSASQSLLEVLSCSKQRILALLTADNQVPMLRQLQELGVLQESGSEQETDSHSFIDLRGAGNTELCKIFTEFAGQLAKVTETPAKNSVRSSKSAELSRSTEFLKSAESLAKLRDGKAVLRILQKVCQIRICNKD